MIHTTAERLAGPLLKEGNCGRDRCVCGQNGCTSIVISFRGHLFSRASSEVNSKTVQMSKLSTESFDYINILLTTFDKNWEFWEVVRAKLCISILLNLNH